MSTPSTFKTVAVTGATGFVGRAVIAELGRRGYTVRALTRDRARAAQIYRPGAGGNGSDGGGSGVELAEIDLLDSGSVARALKGADACVHLVGIAREGPGGKTFQRMHTLATQSVVDACLGAGVRRYLHMSALGAGVGADPGGKGLAVLNGIIDQGVAQYHRTKWAAEQVVRRAGRSARTPTGEPADGLGPSGGRPGPARLDWTIFRPSIILGPGSEFIAMIRRMGSGQMQPWWFIPYFTRPVTDTSVPLGPTHFEAARLQPVAVEDVALAFAEALDRPESIGEIYNLVGPDSVDWRELMLLLRDRVPGVDPGKIVAPIPAPLGVALATAARAVGLGQALAFDAGQAIMSTYDLTGEVAKVREHLGLQARGLDAALGAIAGR
jgi:nucleoside-diphosphate-sugar epimerase